MKQKTLIQISLIVGVLATSLINSQLSAFGGGLLDFEKIIGIK
jgi:hypothetical protein